MHANPVLLRPKCLHYLASHIDWHRLTHNLIPIHTTDTQHAPPTVPALVLSLRCSSTSSPAHRCSAARHSDQRQYCRLPAVCAVNCPYCLTPRLSQSFHPHFHTYPCRYIRVHLHICICPRTSPATSEKRSILGFGTPVPFLPSCPAASSVLPWRHWWVLRHRQILLTPPPKSHPLLAAHSS